MKGICFKELLFIATIKGTKTQTRRIIKATTKLAVITGGSLRGCLK